MPRRTQPTAETADVKDAVQQDGTDAQHAKAGNTKVTLVKPVKAGDAGALLEDPSAASVVDASAASQKSRPKVGRPSGSQKKPDAANTASAKPETKSAQMAEAGDDTTEKPVESARLKVNPWTGSPERSRNAAFTVFLIALFAAVNVALVFLLNGNHHTKAPAVAEIVADAPSMEGVSLPTPPEESPVAAAAPPTAPAEASLPAPSQPAAEPAVAVAPAAVAAVAPAQETAPAAHADTTAEDKAKGRQELLSIIEKN